MNAPEELDQRPRIEAPRFLRGLGAAMAHPRLWLACAALPLALALVLALPWQHGIAHALEHRYAPGDLIASLDETFRFDQRELLQGLQRSSAATGALLAAASMLLGAFCAGGWLAVLLAPGEPRSLRRFAEGGLRHFLAFARVLCGTLLLLALCAWLFHGWPWRKFVLEFAFGLPNGALEELASERSALRLERARDGLHALAVALVLAWGTYTRVRLALRDTRSVVLAGLRSAWMIARHPVLTLRPLLGLYLVQALPIAVLALLALRWNHELDARSGLGSLVLLALPGIAALCWRSIARGAAYAAAIDVSGLLVPPLQVPDPYGERVGAPGGPQYPIGGEEYGV